MRNSLVVMAKYPEPGFVKTRLVPPLTAKDAAGLHRAFLEDTLVRVSTVSDVDIYLAVHPGECAGRLAGEMSAGVLRGVTIVPQEGRDLGERLAGIFNRLLVGANVVVIGSDSPTIPCSYIEQAFELLERNDLVVGPATDGGYYLIGLSKPAPQLFTDIEWGGGEVLSRTLSKAMAHSLKTALLEEWCDVDTPEDLAKLEKELSANGVNAPSTRDYLRALRRSEEIIDLALGKP